MIVTYTCEFCGFKNNVKHKINEHEADCKKITELINIIYDDEWRPGRICNIRTWKRADKIEFYNRIKTYYKKHLRQK